MKIEPQDVVQLAASIRKHEKTARQAVDEALAKAEAFQPDWHAFITLLPEQARQQAEQVDGWLAQNRWLPLAGVPFAVKDLIDIAGTPTTAGSKAFAKRIAKNDAVCVRRLQQAGAICIGKLNLHECAYGFTGENPTHGNPPNPWDRDRVPGGSSSGSAVAVALGICPFTLGSDTGGSIRLPSALCSLTGLKPTYGNVSRAGVTPLSWTLDHVGPMTRTAAESALVMESLVEPNLRSQAMRSPSYTEGLAAPLTGLRIGVPGAWFFGDVQPAVKNAVEAAIDQFEELGAQRQPVELPHLHEVVGAHRAIIFSEASSYYQPHLTERAEQFHPYIRPLLEAGLVLPAVDYLKGQRVRRLVRHEWKKVFADIDCIVTPTSPLVASRWDEQTARLPSGEKPLVRAYLDVTLPFNFSGHPAMSIPCGFSPEGLPIGLQLVGRPFDEGTLLRIAHGYQQATDWHTRVPELD